jgi:hypothetical protein
MKTAIEIDDDKIKGLLCCALEGGSNYWYTIDGYDLADGLTYSDFQKGGKMQGKQYWHPSEIIPFVAGCTVRIRDMEDNNKLYRLDRAALERGLLVMREKAPRHFGDFIADNDDAITGDVFLQCCLFGEVVYG